jgi:hypothetical protein
MVFSYEVIQHNKNGRCELCAIYGAKHWAIQEAESLYRKAIEEKQTHIEYFEVVKDGESIYTVYVD